ncbi:hypothetical protein D3C76_1814980 [compost metagenome]
MKPKSIHQIRISLAESLLARMEVQMARQTNQLQRMPRKKACQKGMAIFLAAVAMSR